MSKSYVPINIRRLIIEISKGYCEYCLMPSDYSPASFTIDHIIPEILDGQTVFENLAYACGSCNRNKYVKVLAFDNITKQDVRLYHPRQDNWHDHFQWNEDETIMIGTTPVGRATIDLLKINRHNNINQRALLRLVGIHPPMDYS